MSEAQTAPDGPQKPGNIAEWLSARPLLAVLLGVALLPAALPMGAVALLLGGIPALLWFLSSRSAPKEEATTPAQVGADGELAAVSPTAVRAQKQQELAAAAAAAAKQQSVAAAAAAAPPAATPPAVLAAAPAPAASAAAAPIAAAAGGAAALTGSAALLAKIRAQRDSSGGSGAAGGGAAKSAGKVAVLFASQTGTGREIANSIHAECAGHGIASVCMSLNELGWPNLAPERYPVVVVVASSTGDGDPPDNSANFWVAMKKSQPPGRLAGVAFTVLALGDSNYTRYMHVPRVIKSRFKDMGANNFYTCAEADEVDGLESVVDDWVEGLWAPLKQAFNAAAKPDAAKPASGAAAGAAAAAVSVTATAAAAAGAGLAAESSAALLASVTAPAAAAPPPSGPRVAVEAGDASGLVGGLAPPSVDLKGVPALAPCRVAVRAGVDAATAARIRAEEASVPSPQQRAYRDPTGMYSPEQPFWATLKDARLLTAPSSDRRVLHLELDLSGSGMRYGPGDSVGLLPQNEAKLVEALLKRLGLPGEEVFDVAPAGDADAGGAALLPHLHCPCTYGHAFTHSLDLTSPPRKSLLRLLAEHTSNEGEKRTLLFFTARAGREAYAAEVVQGQPSLLDLLARFPSCRPPVAALLDVLPPLAPRLYSVTTAPFDHPESLQVALSVVSYPTKYGKRHGVATTWLDRLAAPLIAAHTSSNGKASGAASKQQQQPVLLPAFLRVSESFKPPASPATPVVMIGPGTGVAPFRGFLQQRRQQLAAPGAPAAGTALLFFGCRRAEEDFLYKKDLEAFASSGVLSKLHVAFSRAQAEKRYVQHLLAEQGAAVAATIAGGGYVYVCGDGAAMVKDVHAALIALLVAHGGVGEAAAAEQLVHMTREGRYVRDVWC